MPDMSKTGDQPASILDKPVVQEMLNDANAEMRQEGAVTSHLFLRTEAGERLVYPVEMPETAAARCHYFAILGATLRHQNRRPQEAVLVAGGWMVFAEGDQEVSPALPPSQHPQRQEVITLVGRNADRTRVVSGMQLLCGGTNPPIWSRLETTEHGATTQRGSQPEGLLDFLFAGETAADPQKSRKDH